MALATSTRQMHGVTIVDCAGRVHHVEVYMLAADEGRWVLRIQ